MQDKQSEMDFLADNFDISAARAAALVAESEQEASRLAAQRLAQERGESPYDDAPIPVSPEERHVPEDGGLQKPVLNRDNQAGRAGP